MTADKKCAACTANTYFSPALQQCETCSPDCTSCTSKDTCTGCKAPLGLNKEGKCAPCGFSTFYNSKIDGCSKCAPNCAACLDQNTCL